MTSPKQNKISKRRDPHLALKGVDARIKPIKGVEIKPDIEIQPDTSGWLTRYQSADFLGVSVTTIANYERHGKLHPRYDYRDDSRKIEQRVTVYDPKQLALLKKYPSARRDKIKDLGELAASCFELFDQGRTLREIVIALRETPEQIRALHESWLDAGGADFTITQIAREKIEKIVGQFSSVAKLLPLIERLAKPKEEGRVL